MDQKDALKANFVILLKTWPQIAGKKQTDLGRDQTMAKNEEVLPHLQWMGYFTTKFDSHLRGNWVHSHAHTWLHTFIYLHEY